jgi:caffeoyl-CoA O-methyltransferase
MIDDMFTALQQYCEAHTSPPPPLLEQLARETHLKTLAPQMLSGALQGRFLALVSRLLRPARIVEVGTFTGYSAICLAEGLAEGGILHTIEGNEELFYLIRKYLSAAGLEEKVVLHPGNALDVLVNLDGPFDLVFLDANKQEYGAYYDLVIDKVRPGGLILADNVLWSGKVLQAGQDADADALRAFNQKVLDDGRVDKVMLPLRDGLLIVQKL